MKEFFIKLKDQGLAKHKSLDKKNKIILYSVGAAFVILMTVLILVLVSVTYIPVAQGLSYEEASSVTAKLTELGIPWEGSTDMSTISVPENQVSTAKMELAVSNVYLEDDYTWTDSFANESISTTSETREKMHTIAQATGIEHAIETINGVGNAQVQLVIPADSSFFMSNSPESRASVVLTLEKGVVLSSDQVKGIVNLMVSSVESLESENITVIDNTGIQLNTEEDSEFTSVSSKYEQQLLTQNDIKNYVEKFLTNIYGYGNVKVEARVVLDFDSELETQKLYSPPVSDETSGMVRSSAILSETVINGSDATGSPGTDSNGETTNYTESSTSDDSTYKSASETINYEMNEIYKEIVKSEGEVEELSIAVIVNTNALVEGQLSNEDRLELIDLVAYAALTDQENITVRAYAFADPMEGYDVYEGETSPTLGGIPYWAIILILVLIILVIIIVLVLRKKSQTKAEEAKEKARIEEEKASEEEDKLKEILTNEVDTESPRFHIESFIDKNPDAAAALLRSWINED